MVVFRQAMRGEHDRCFFSSSLAACPPGEGSFIFSTKPRTAPISTNATPRT